MQSDKTFIAITSEIHNEKTVYLYTSCGDALFNENGIGYLEATQFLFNLVHKRKRTGGIVFVTFAFQRDNEFIFSTLPKVLKDKLFRAQPVKRETDALEFELESIEDDYYKYDPGTQEYELADFERHVNKLALEELREVEFDGFKIKLVNGKYLTICKGGKSITIYDLYGFFRPDSLYTVVRNYLGSSNPLLDRRVFNSKDFFIGESDCQRLKAHAVYECGFVQKLAEKLNERLTRSGIKLSRFHGATAIASKLLSESRARKQYHNYRYKRQFSPDLYTGLYKSIFGGRAEQFKIGTLGDVHVYDINSAYAQAATQLPILLSKPKYYDEWQSIPFSFWQCEYDFSNVGLYYGLFPNRELTKHTKYKLKGSGVFWQPEIKFALEHYPECVKINYGYAVENDLADFTKYIQEYYDLRNELKSKNDPLEKVVKLALASIYGKFAQHNGNGHYHNMFYAGFITSTTRAALLSAAHGNESSIIAFQTDAIHSRKTLPVLLNEQLGAFKYSHYDRVTYLDNGVYQCYRMETNKRTFQIVKTKTRGFRTFNFPAAIAELKQRRSYTGTAELFMGHNLFTQNIFQGIPYLSDVAEPKTTRPTENNYNAMRIFEARDIDLTRDFLDSRPIEVWNGLESAPYVLRGEVKRDAGIDTLEACRV